MMLPIRSITWRFYEKRKGLIEWCQTKISLLTGSSPCFFILPQTYLALYELKYQHFLFKELKNQAPCCIFTGESEKSVRMEMQEWVYLFTCSALVYSCLIFHSKPQHLSQLGARKLCASMFSIRPGWGFPLAYNLSLLS